MKKFIYLAATLLVALPTTGHAQTLADYANAGDAAYAAGKFQEAIDNYIKAQELDTENTDYLTAMQLGTAYQQIGDNTKAGDAFKASLIKGNPDGAVITNMKNAYEADGCTECVKNAYIEIKTINPAQTIAMDRKLYFIYAKEKNDAEALKCALSILSDPNNDEATQIKYNKSAAQLYLNLDQADSAEVYYDKVLAINPDDPDVHKALGVGFYKQIQKVKANSEARYSKLGSKATQHDRSVMLTEQKRATLNYGPKAVKHLQVAVKQKPDPQLSQIITQLQNNIAAYNK